MILRNLIGKEECSENDHFMDTQISKNIDLRRCIPFCIHLFEFSPVLTIFFFKFKLKLIYK